MIGQGAEGTARKGMWEGQHVCVKIVEAYVSNDDSNRKDVSDTLAVSASTRALHEVEDEARLLVRLRHPVRFDLLQTQFG